MSWGTRFRIRQQIKGSLWFTPIFGVAFGAAFAAIDVKLEGSLDLPAYWQYSPTTASTVLTTIVGAMVGLTGFVVTVSVLVVQMAASTFSARYMRLWYRDRMLQALLAVLVGALAFSFSLLRRITADSVPNLGVTVAGGLVIAALLLFLFFLDRCIHRLRPVAVAAVVAEQGRSAFRAAAPMSSAAPSEPVSLDQAPAYVVRAPSGGAIQAIDEDGLVRFARERGCLLVFKRSAGDFVVSGAPLIEVFGPVVENERDVGTLRGKVVLGIERTIEQDVAFAIRTLVDVAVKALSAAINDPTTAVQVIDHLGEMMRLIGTTDLTTHSRLRDEEGCLRVVLPTRRWEDYLSLAVTEIREYGASSIQVMRRLRSLLDDLLGEVRVEHRSAVEDELARLNETIAVSFGDSIDLDRAVLADRQGIGGPSVALPPALG